MSFDRAPTSTKEAVWIQERELMDFELEGGSYSTSSVGGATIKVIRGGVDDGRITAPPLTVRLSEMNGPDVARLLCRFGKHLALSSPG